MTQFSIVVAMVWKPTLSKALQKLKSNTGISSTYIVSPQPHQSIGQTPRGIRKMTENCMDAYYKILINKGLFTRIAYIDYNLVRAENWHCAAINLHNKY